MDSDSFLFCFNDFLDKLRNLNNFLQNLSDRDELLNDQFNWHWNFFWHDDCGWYFDRFKNFMIHWDNFLYVKSFWNLVNQLNCVLDSYFMNDCFLLSVCNSYEFIYDSLDGFLHFNINVFNNLDFHYSLLDYWNLNAPFDFFDYYFFSFHLHKFLHNLWDFYDFLYHTGNCDEFFNDPLHFDEFWYLNNFLNDLFNINSNFLDSFDILGNLD